MKLFNWVKRLFGFGEKKTIAIDIETGGLHGNNPIYVTEAYKTDHKKHHDAMLDLLKKIEENKKTQLGGGESMVNKSNLYITLNKKKDDDTTKALHNFKTTLDKHYSRTIEPDTSRDSSFIDSMVIGALTDSTVAGTIIGGDPIGAMIGDMLNTSDETPNYESPSYESEDYSRNTFDEGYSNGNDSDYGSSSSDYSSPSYDE